MDIIPHFACVARALGKRPSPPSAARRKINGRAAVSLKLFWLFITKGPRAAASKLGIRAGFCMTFSRRAGKGAQRLYRFFLQLSGACFALCALACCAGCAESNARKDEGAVQVEERTGEILTSWFYFDSSESLVEAPSPSAIPSPGFRPWTEAPAVMDAGVAGGFPILLVNKKGALSAETLLPSPAMAAREGGPAPAFAVPRDVFPSASSLSAGTLASLAFEEGKTFVRFYKSIVFDSDRASQPVALFLCGEAPYFPLEAAFFASDFGASEDAQFVSLNYAAGDEPWAAAFKSRVGVAGSVMFEYFALAALPGSSGFSSRKVSADEFNSLSESARGEEVPQAFASMLSLVPERARVSMQIAGEGFPKSREFVTGGHEESLSAWGFAFNGAAAALFSDGTFYYSPSENSGVVKCLRFPRLNGGYTYTALIFSEEGILAGWEERRFYETGRSGIIAVSVPAGFFS